MRVWLPYHSPHKFFHGFAVYSLKYSKDIHTLKAVSQSLMHSYLSITDGVYGILSGVDVKGRIADLAEKKYVMKFEDKQEILISMEQLLEKLKMANKFIRNNPHRFPWHK